MKLLVIEDTQNLRYMLKKGLTQENFVVDTATDGNEGLRKAYTEDYDVIILDLNLPDIDGVGVCKKLREAEVNTPVIMLTVRDQIEDKIKGLDAGADDYITKPFEFNELLARIRAAARKNGQEKTEQLKVADLTLDSKTHEVKRDGKGISLSRQEFLILQCLMKNKNMTLSKYQILAKSWEEEFEAESNVVEVHISNLRKKIDKGRKKKLIKTVRGQGYKIADG